VTVPVVEGLPPIVGRRPRPHTLILGSMPGIASLEAREYYGHPRNAFWDVAEALGIPRALPYRSRCARLRHLGFALWDVLAECERAGSLDQAIRAPRANDLVDFARHHAPVRVWFNGQAARRHFDRLLARDFAVAHPGVELRTLPSTSPAHTARSKIVTWRRALVDAAHRAWGEPPEQVLARRFAAR
jgi:hypoxanthine-DNA glycosylase